MADGQWIVVPNWDKFQHYKHRNPPWIKNYTALLHKDEYLDLSLADRGLLHGIWLMYAEHTGLLRPVDLRAIADPKRTPEASRVFAQRSLRRLNQAGLMGFSASKSLCNSVTSAHARTREDVRQQAAEAWIRNGGAAQVPAGHLEDILREDYHVRDPELIAALLAKVGPLQ